MDLHSEGGRLLVSFLLGMAVGIEREISDKPAGLRTNVLICLGATLFTILSTHWIGVAGTEDAHIAAQIVSGIGFLGAGAIMREGEHVTGLTTAATIWMVAAIGMAVGLGHHKLAAMATIMTLLVQTALARLDMVVDLMRRRYNFRILSDPDDKAIEAIGRILKAHGIRVIDHKVMKKNNLYLSHWSTTGSAKGQGAATKDLLKSDRVMEVMY